MTNALHKAKIFVAITMLVVLKTSAQLPDYQLLMLHKQQGLKTADIINMVRDQDGYMWLASQGHVQRFDGGKTKLFTFSETVEQIFCDAQNRKWVITRRNVFLFVNDYKGFITVHSLQSNDMPVIKLYAGIDNKVFLFRGNGQFIYNESKKVFEPLTSNILRGQLTYRRAFAASGTDIYYATRDSIFYDDIGSAENAAISFKKTRSIIPLGNKRLLVSDTEFKTFYIDMASGSQLIIELRKTAVNKSPEHLIVYSGVGLDSSRFLVSSTNGLLIFNTNSKTFSSPILYYNGKLLENQQSITNLYKDKRDVVYMNHADGIYYMDKAINNMRFVRNYSYGKESLPDSDIRNFAEDETGKIWMATTKGIVSLDLINGMVKRYTTADKPIAINFPSYRQLLHDGSNLWIGSSGDGIWILNKKTGLFKRVPSQNTDEGKQLSSELSNAYVWKILKLADGRFFVATGSNCYTIQPGSFLTKKLSFATARLNSRSAVQDSAGRIWHGTVAGLSCSDTSFNTLFLTKDSFPDQRISAFCEWRQNQMLVGTKGLYEITVSENRMVSFQKKSAVLSNRFIYCMQKDGQGFIWLGTDDGLYRYDPEKDEAVLFDQSDNIQTQAFNSDAAFLSSTGLMFAGGKNGFNYFHPPSIQFHGNKLNPLIETFSINGNDSTFFMNPGPHNIKYKDRNIAFSVSAPDFKNPFNIHYRYKINGLYEEWKYNGLQHAATITNLAPGNYSLQVSASPDGTSWYDSKNIIRFTILKPWWQTWWFKTIIATLLFFIAWGILQRLRQKRAAEEIKRTIDYFALSGTGYSSTDDILWDIARNCISRLGFEDCVIYLVDEERQMLVQKAAYGLKSTNTFEIVNPIEIPVGTGITGYVAQTGKAMIIADTSKEERYLVDDERRASELAVPVIHDGKVIGIIDSEHRKRNFFTTNHLKTIRTIASLCSSKISVSIAREAVQNAANELNILNSKMLEAKFMNLRLQMNPHFLFNVLTSIQYLVVSHQTNNATKYLSIFSGFLRSILQYAQETMVPLEVELRMLKMYIELESLCLDETFQWQIEIDESIDQEEALVPFMMLQPFLENAIHHGLMNKTGSKEFKVFVTQSNEENFTCIIEDNGVGRKNAASVNHKNHSPVEHKSKGIAIIEERLALISKKTSQKAGVKIEDLFNNNVPSGTRVEITIPYYNTDEI